MTKSSDTDIIDPFEAAMEMGDIKGRSPWEDAWHRLLRNRAAVFSAVIMAVLVAMVLIGPMLISGLLGARMIASDAEMASNTPGAGVAAAMPAKRIERTRGSARRRTR